MADENEPAGTPPAEGAPVTETPPVVEPVAEAPVVEAPAEEAPNAHAEPTLLESVSGETKPPEAADTPAETAPEADKPVAEVKPAEAPKPDDVKPGETPEAPPEPAPVTFEKFEVPEDFRVDDTRMAEFTGLLGKPRNQENAQAIINFGIDQMRMYAETLSRAQHETWTNTRKAWRDEVKADPEIGGAGFETAMARVGRMRDLFVTQGDQKAFSDFLRVTGAGDHPAFLRFLYRVGQKFDEGQQAPAPANPPPDRGGGRPRGGRGRLGAVLYDNSRSQ